MFRRLLVPTLTAALVLSACAELPTTATASLSDDFSLVMFGPSGAALEGTMGQQGPRPFDGRSQQRQLPDSLALTEAQKTAMQELRTAFRTEHAAQLDSLRAVFQKARDARRNGASREEVQAILQTGRPIAEALRPAVQALHEAIRAVLTDAQRAWLDANRPPMGQRRRRP